MPSPLPLENGRYYHIFNRGTNGENLFRERRNYRFFLQRYVRHIEPVAETFAYCLLKNHFHLLICTRTDDYRGKPSRPSQHFANFFAAYAKSFNKTYGRTGSLFEHPFRRVEVTSDAYFCQLVVYIHWNPQHHGFVDDFRDWPFSSYRAVMSKKPTRVQREAVVEWFGGQGQFVDAHGNEPDKGRLRSVLLEARP